MLLLQQPGALKVGEVVRYTITYTPSRDRILPHPSHLHLRIKNTSAIALRAAFMHGPYALYVSAAPSTHRVDVASGVSARLDGVPEFEPNLKPGAAWAARLKVRGDEETSWVVEVASQVIFSASAGVRFEVLVGRDEGSVGGEMGAGKGARQGVFSEAVRVRVEDTAGLWNTPRLPEWEGRGGGSMSGGEGVRRVGKVEEGKVEEGKKVEGERANGEEKTDDRKQKKIHLVVLTHGLHSNLGADMLYMKESIDAGAKKAKEEAKLRRDKRRKERAEAASAQSSSINADVTSEQKHAKDDDTDDEEDVIVRGFSGNAVRTEKGIKYLGKRLAKYVLAMTYPDQSLHSVRISAGESFKAAVTHDKSREVELGEAVHPHSSIQKDPPTGKKRAYKITSISFIAHSLGGLIQTYAVAYIQKHSPDFFEKIQAVNFICLASPFLGLSNENPLYVKFALDFGLVGRTGQDLGLTWRAPTLARSGWGALVSGIGENAKNSIEHPRDPRSKPLLRILPTGPAHVALKKFRNRTVYSNVVNDGIVPLRTSCLLFLDWQGLGRVEKARRENGLVGTMAGWGWAELTGQNATAAARQEWMEEARETEAAQAQAEANGSNTPTRQGRGGDVPQPPPDATEDDVRSLKSMKMTRRSSSQQRTSSNVKENELHPPPQQSPPITGTASTKGPIDSFLDFFNPRAKSPDSPTQSKIYKRSQTVKFDDTSRKSDSKTDSSSKTDSTRKTDSDSSTNHTPGISSAFHEDPQGSAAPHELASSKPRATSSAPPPPALLPHRPLHAPPHHLPRPRLPPSPPASNHSTNRIATTASDSSLSPLPEIDSSAMKVEEKIARAYHRDLAWRKVLVRLEPDAHNNIIVRRKFANAYGWPVVQHLVDTHFAGSGAAVTPDDEEGKEDRAAGKSPRGHGGDGEGPAPHQFLNQALMREREEEDRESVDHLSSLGDAVSTHTHTHTMQRVRNPVLERADSEVWREGGGAVWKTEKS
ncbi:hypothetical protein GMDG_01262 [Pseudogymnoascus destructans 20631-21]|uniref:DUF676 domain-containing protein n=1 Tax=Pseudogymnoascus destructans (strain ATCC MYA-4855 / 20631-21) TaxID=658429 RepID=L8FUT9_PSED2|nr:hypothetical protein GMDG_01262 [Pseudogymnoascus destructans 20631-21]